MASGSCGWPGFTVDGFFFPEAQYDINAVKGRYIDRWDIRDDDVIIATFTKSGTLWMHAILREMYEDLNWQVPETKKAVRLDQLYEHTDDKSNLYSVHKRAVQTTLHTISSPRLFTCHLPPQLFHTAWKDGTTRCKVICVTRNPKDVCVSFYHHVWSMPSVTHMDLTWDGWVNAFVDGKVTTGPWPDFVLSWQQYGLEDNVLHICYEDMKKDLKTELRKIVEFLGQPRSDGEIERVIANTTFDALKNKTDDNCNGSQG
ncbi:sulfotransferase 1E1-like [Glandiceps talaboti]